MPKFYVSFGQIHTHSHNGQTLDKDSIGVIEASNEEQARKLAFEWFGRTWSMLYTEKPNMDFFPRGLINLN